jgi:hypothetical protein
VTIAKSEEAGPNCNIPVSTWWSSEISENQKSIMCRSSMVGAGGGMELPVGDRPASTCVVEKRLRPAVLGAGSLANRENGIAGIFFISAVLLAGTALLFSNAAGEISVGPGWASDACSTSQIFCHHPKYLAYAAGAVLVIASRIKLGSAAS